MKTKKGTQHEQPMGGVKSRQPDKQARHRWLYMILAVAVLLIASVGLAVWYYSGRALPNVAVGNVMVGSQSPAAIRAAITQQVPALRITFEEDGKKVTVPAHDLGVVVDVEATLQDTLHARRAPNVLSDVSVWQTATVPLVLTNDPGILIEYARQHFPSVFVDAKEPQIVFDDAASQFKVVPGQPGKGLDIKSFERALPSLAQQPQGFTLKLTSQPVTPLLDESKLNVVRDEANVRIKQKVEFKANGQAIYTAKPSEIASWMNFAPDAASGTVKLVVDKAKVQQFLTDKVGPTVAAPPIDRKVVVDSSTGAQSVIQQGRAGSQIQSVETLTDDVVGLLTDNKEVSKDVSIATAPFKTVTVTGSGKWIEIDVSKETATMWLGNQMVKSFLISSGRAGTPTELGEFAIYSKTPSMTMTGTVAGDFFYLPNVKWVSFFDGGEAFHGTYWHHNFGHPMSHGCINMTEADAKTLYDFAPVGTKVVVHA